MSNTKSTTVSRETTNYKPSITGDEETYFFDRYSNDWYMIPAATRKMWDNLNSQAKSENEIIADEAKEAIEKVFTKFRINGNISIFEFIPVFGRKH